MMKKEVDDGAVDMIPPFSAWIRSVRMAEASLDEVVSIRCYQFVKEVWPHLGRTEERDGGFERAFRDWIATQIPFTAVTCVHNLGLGLSDRSLTDCAHEIDVVAMTDTALHVFELKNYPSSVLPKEWVIIFLHKVLDYYLKNIGLLHSRAVNLVFVTTSEPDAPSRLICYT